MNGAFYVVYSATCRLDDVSLRTLVLARQVPDKELKEFLEKNKELLNS